jgi:D-3-phosphoglycerate dehydrogenase
MQALSPYMRLAEKLGSLYAQAGSGGLKKLELDYTGELARHDVSYLTAEVLRGLLAGFTEERINVVNARLVAAARGIEVTELRTSAGVASKGATEYPDLVTLRATGGETFVAAATVLPQGPRIVRLDSFVIDLTPEGRFILTYHDDRPGVIGKVGTILGDANINIAALHLGRDAPRGRAVMIVQVDDQVPDEVKQRLLAIDGMSNLRLVEL